MRFVGQVHNTVAEAMFLDQTQAHSQTLWKPAGPGAYYNWVDIVLDPVDDSGAQGMGRNMRPAGVHIRRPRQRIGAPPPDRRTVRDGVRPVLTDSSVVENTTLSLFRQISPYSRSTGVHPAQCRMSPRPSSPHTRRPYNSAATERSRSLMKECTSSLGALQSNSLWASAMKPSKEPIPV